MDIEQKPSIELRADEARKPASQGPAAELPYDGLIIIPVRNLVLFPGLIVPLNVARGRSIAAAQEAARTGRRVGVLLQRHPEVEDPAVRDLYTVGTTAGILRYLTTPDGAHNLVCQGE
jgi:ATP-dependent Lon protease